MNYKKVLLFGSTGGIGSHLKELLVNKNYKIFCPTRKELDFNSQNCSILLEDIITQQLPDVIINASGILGNNDTNYESIFNINFKSNWDIVNYYKKYGSAKPVKIIMIGSSAYKSGRKNYILYASSKSALFSMFQGASELFESSNVMLGLINPSKVDTKMISSFNLNSSELKNPRDVANSIVYFFENMTKSDHIDIK